MIDRVVVIGKVPGGGDVVVGTGDGGVVPPEVIQQENPNAGVGNSKVAGIGEPSIGQVGFGNAAATAKSSGLGEPLGSQGLQGEPGLK